MAKVRTVRTQWVPAVNDHGRVRPLGILEVTDP